MSLNPSPTVASTRTSGPPCVCGCLTRPRRYPSDLTDAQWAVLEPLLPAPSWQRTTGGRPERHSRRQIINALFYLVDNGIKWRAMPADFPPWRTVYGYFIRWSDNLTTVGLTHRLRASLRAALGRRAQPSAGCIDAQSVHESAEGVVPRATSGYDSHKRVNGRKRHILVDTVGLLIDVVATTASAADQHVAPARLLTAADHGIRCVWADQGYYVDKLIVRRTPRL
ncbi:IS5 family transposase [Micromonospora aurantiaca]|uniref:IS5 family transposase n=1 Tax=Micromonospora aurantiaca (nom. illeg.) TaxID=47850 RepID=UPI0033CB3101